MAYSKIRPRRGTLYEWTIINPVLASGELVLEVPDTGVGTGLSKFKIGDGIHSYNDLPYAFNGAAAAALMGGDAVNFSLLQIRAADRATWRAVNPVLAEHEFVFDTTTQGFKIGDGVYPFNDLDYLEFASSWYRDNTGNYHSVYDFGDEDNPDSPNMILSASTNPTPTYAGSKYSGDHKDYYDDHILPPDWNESLNNQTPVSAPTEQEEEKKEDSSETNNEEEESTVGINDLVK